MELEKLNLPPQVENMIRGLLNPRETTHVRNNYRNSLDVIRVEIEKAINKFDRDGQ